MVKQAKKIKIKCPHCKEIIKPYLSKEGFQCPDCQGKWSYKMSNFEVIVGNIGTVYRGENKFLAYHEFNAYKVLSNEGYGRVAGENVTLIEDNEIVKEHIGDIQKIEELKEEYKTIE